MGIVKVYGIPPDGFVWRLISNQPVSVRKKNQTYPSAM